MAVAGLISCHGCRHFLLPLPTFLATRERKGYFFAVSGMMAEPSAADV
jgi:hypothetical protein